MRAACNEGFIFYLMLCVIGEQKRREEFYAERGETDPSKWLQIKDTADTERGQPQYLL